MTNTFEEKNPNLIQDYSLVEIWQTFMYLTENRKLLSNWHIEYIFEHLKNIIEKKDKNLILNVPPGHSKTTIMMAFAAIYLGYYPTTRVLILSAVENVRIKYARGIKTIIESDVFKQLFNNNLEIDENDINRLDKFFIKKTMGSDGKIIGGGQVNIMSTDSRITGTDADLVIVDDPIDYTTYNIQGPDYIAKINGNINGFFSRRREVMGLRDVPFVLIMQRICDGDTTDFLLNGKKTADWTHIKIPIVEEEKQIIGKSPKTGKYLYGKVYKVNNFKYSRKYEEILFNKIKNTESIAEEKESYIYLGKEGDFFWQYYQRGSKEQNSIFNVNNIRYYDKNEFPINDFDKVIQSWDTGFGKNKLGDPSCCTTWGLEITENEKTKRKDFIAYLINVWFTHDSYPNLKKKALDLIETYQPNNILIEDKANGQSLIQDLEMEFYGKSLDQKDIRKNKKIVAVKVSSRTGNKEDRAKACSHLIDRGSVVFPNDYKTVIFLYGKQINPLKELKHQLRAFPSTAKKCHDDGVDSVTQFLNWAKTEFIKKKTEVKLWFI